MGSAKSVPIESELNESFFKKSGAGDEEVAAFVRIIRSFLALEPAQRPRAAVALLDPGFEYAL